MSDITEPSKVRAHSAAPDETPLTLVLVSHLSSLPPPRRSLSGSPRPSPSPSTHLPPYATSLQTSGNYDYAVGSIKETIGNAVGAESLAQAGSEQAAKGDAEYKLAQTQEYAEGTADRVGGKIDRVIGAATGDHTKEAAGLAQETKGKAQQGASSFLLPLPLTSELELTPSSLPAAANS